MKEQTSSPKGLFSGQAQTPLLQNTYCQKKIDCSPTKRSHNTTLILGRNTQRRPAKSERRKSRSGAKYRLEFTQIRCYFWYYPGQFDLNAKIVKARQAWFILYGRPHRSQTVHTQGTPGGSEAQVTRSSTGNHQSSSRSRQVPRDTDRLLARGFKNAQLVDIQFCWHSNKIFVERAVGDRLVVVRSERHFNSSMLPAGRAQLWFSLYSFLPWLLLQTTKQTCWNLMTVFCLMISNIDTVYISILGLVKINIAANHTTWFVLFMFGMQCVAAPGYLLSGSKRCPHRPPLRAIFVR